MRDQFKAGDPVPPHVLDVEPLDPSGGRPALLFTADCDVIDLGEKYLLLTTQAGQSSTVRVDTRGHTGKVLVFAPSKPVWIMNTWTEFQARFPV